MFDYSPQLETFHAIHVRLPWGLLGKLREHRKANRDRIISRLPDQIDGIQVSESHFKPQGSVAMGTILQTKFADEEYDIDDGLVLPRSKLVDEDGAELDAATVRERIQTALKDARFKRQPEIMTNCVRVFYAVEDAEKHHVDFPVYRKWTDGNEIVRELAGGDGWVESEPTRVNKWFADEIEKRNAEGSQHEKRGTQLRRLIRLLKRFCRSREDWLDLLPNGMKLTMLAAECQPGYEQRIDRAFRDLLENIAQRLRMSKVIRNLAHPDQSPITRTESDDNVEALLDKIDEVLTKLAVLDDPEHYDLDSAREAWEWVFQSDGYFEKYDVAIAKSEVQKGLTRVDAAVQLDVPWRQVPPWPSSDNVPVRVVARRLMQHGGWRGFESGTLLPKGSSLEFEAETSLRGPYEIFWQIVNTGVEAHLDRQLRGTFEESGPLRSNKNRGVREESTAYTGRHWVEAFLVQQGRCLGRSGPFVVAVE